MASVSVGFFARRLEECFNFRFSNAPKLAREQEKKLITETLVLKVRAIMYIS